MTSLGLRNHVKWNDPRYGSVILFEKWSRDYAGR